ncbi:MAG: polysaccharide deacetylase family protein [Myxococcales bacterium]|nr:polysaccharide deacetylase family protein [Myxococcota bacterium]MDW8282427.1 polysaccharide deacetylase family protein [Myxococcales bacterium]
MLLRGLLRAAGGLDRIGLLEALARARRWLPRRSLVVLNYHRVLAAEPELDEGVVSATPQEFDDQMRLIARVGTCISLSRLIRVLRGEAALPDNAIMVTFDDGYADNFTAALPALLRHGVRATFFIATGFIETGRLPWWDRASYVIKRAQVSRLELSYPVRLSLPLTSAADRRRARRTILRVIKQVQGTDLERFLDRLQAAAGVSIDESALARGLFMTWDQIAQIRDTGMDIGAHTHTHRVLQTLPEQEARRELSLSAQILTQRLGIVPRAIAYPVGFPLSPTSSLRRLLQEAGYEVGFTFMPGFICPPPWGPPVDRFNLPRLSVDRSASHAGSRFKLALMAPPCLL